MAPRRRAPAGAAGGSRTSFRLVLAFVYTRLRLSPAAPEPGVMYPKLYPNRPFGGWR